MSSSQNLEEVAEQALKEKSQALQEKKEAEARVKYLQTQLAQLMRERQRTLGIQLPQVTQVRRRKPLIRREAL